MSSAVDSARESASMASVEDIAGASGFDSEIMMPRRSMACVRCVKRTSSAGMWIGLVGEMVSVCVGTVRSCKLSVCAKASLAVKKKGFEVGEPYALNYACADPGYCALDSLVARRAHHQRAARFNGRQQRVAVFQTMLQLAAYFDDFVNKPCQLTVLHCVQVSWSTLSEKAVMASLP